jgi:DNA-binding winged helix-turn-helix (wHTH) protein
MKAFSTFRLDIKNECLWRLADDGVERVPLTPKAFTLLVHLVENAGRLVRLEELLDAVWPNTTVEPQAVKKHIGALRSALGDSPSQPRFIETATKRGYRFVAPVEDLASSLSANDDELPSEIVGRERALEDLGELWRLAAQGSPQVVVITGEPGIGKSALAEEFRRRIAATESSALISQGQCVEGYGSKEPYGPFLDALGHLCRGGRADAVVGAMLAEAPTWLTHFPGVLKPDQLPSLRREIAGATRERMLREFAQAVHSISQTSPLLLVLEDVQWIDGSSADLISYLSRRNQPARFMLLTTCRTLEAEAEDNPLKSLLPELLVHRRCKEIALTPLDLGSVGHFLKIQGGGDVPPAFAELLYRHSEGNPLFIVAALETMRKQNLVSAGDRGFTLQVPIEKIGLVVPEDLRTMIEAQIQRLTDREIQALEFASVAGASFSAAITGRADGSDMRELEDLYEALSKRHRFVRWANTQGYPDGTLAERYEFAHALYRKVLYDRVPPVRRAAYHRALGERIEGLHSSRIEDLASELAFHFDLGGDYERCVRYLRLSAEVAGRRRAHQAAATMLRRALAIVPRLPEATRAETEVQILVALATHRMSAFDPEVVDTYEMLASRAAEFGMIDVQVQALLDLSFYLSLSSRERCMDAADRALYLSTGQTPRQGARTRAVCAMRRLLVTDWSNADADIILDYYTREARVRLLTSHELVDLSLVEFYCGMYRPSLEHALTVRARMSEPGAMPDLADFEMADAIVLANRIFLGNWGDALTGIHTEIAIARRNENSPRTMWLYANLAWFYLHTANFDRVIPACLDDASLRGALRRDGPVDGSGVPAIERAAIICAGSAAASIGDLEPARGYLYRALAEMDRQPATTNWHWRMHLEHGLVKLHISEGKLEDAERVAEQFVARALATVERSWQALAWDASARVAMACGDHRRARGLISRAVDAIQGFEGPVAAWQVFATAAEISAHLNDHEAMRDHLDACHALVASLASSVQDHEEVRRNFLADPRVTWVLSRVGSQLDESMSGL